MIEEFGYLSEQEIDRCGELFLIRSHDTHSYSRAHACFLVSTSQRLRRDRGTPETSLSLSFKLCMFDVFGRETQYLVGNSGPVSAQSLTSKTTICLNGCCGISRVM